MAAAVQQRQWYLDDKTENRTYDFAVEQEARQYERAQLEDTRAYSRQVLQHLTEDATAAGFNPLTVLRGGGASSYNAAAGLAPLSATRAFSSPAQAMTVPSRQAVGGSSMGTAMQAVGDFLENFDPFADQKKEQEYQLVASQIAALNASALSGVARGAGSYASGTTERRPSGVGGALAKSAGGNKPGEGTIVGGDDPAVSSFGWNNGDFGYFHAPWMPDAEVNEKINGDNELVSLAYSAAKIANDWGYSAYRNGSAAYKWAADGWRKAKAKAGKTAKPQTAHQADPGSWMDFAPKLKR